MWLVYLNAYGDGKPIFLSKVLGSVAEEDGEKGGKEVD